MYKRTIVAPQRSDGSYVVFGKQVLESLKHLHGFVLLDDCLIYVKDLREFANIYEKDFLTMLKETDYLCVKTGKNTSRFWDRRNLPSSPPTPSPFATTAWEECFGKHRLLKPPSGMVEFVKMQMLW